MPPVGVKLKRANWLTCKRAAWMAQAHKDLASFKRCQLSCVSSGLPEGLRARAWAFRRFKFSRSCAARRSSRSFRAACFRDKSSVIGFVPLAPRSPRRISRALPVFYSADRGKPPLSIDAPPHFLSIRARRGKVHRTCLASSESRSSSVVERTLGKGEVEGSIPLGGFGMNAVRRELFIAR